MSNFIFPEYRNYGSVTITSLANPADIWAYVLNKAGYPSDLASAILNLMLSEAPVGLENRITCMAESTYSAFLMHDFIFAMSQDTYGVGDTIDLSSSMPIYDYYIEIGGSKPVTAENISQTEHSFWKTSWTPFVGEYNDNGVYCVSNINALGGSSSHVVTVPIQWKSPYDKKNYETTFPITVTT